MKILSMKLKTAIVIVLMFAAILTAIIYIGTKATNVFSDNGRKIPIYSVETDSNKVAVTFNCAVGNSDIDKILSILEAYDVKATFFMLGSWAEKYPDEVQKIYDRGHNIGNHSYSHSDLPNLSYDDILYDISKCNETVRNITGEATTLFRAPSGSYDNKTLSAAEELGMTSIQWDVDSLDWKNNSADDILKRVTRKTVSGSIIQFHTGTDHTAEALPKVLDWLKENKLNAVTIDELIYKNNYIIDRNGKQSVKNSEESTCNLNYKTK